MNLIVIMLIALLIVGFIGYHIAIAPFGYEDKDGFHYGLPPKGKK